MNDLSENRICQNCKVDFQIEPDDFSFYEKIKVPPPTFCSDCRRQRRLSWRNTYNLYNRTCDLCQKSIVSIYSLDSGLTVYCVKCFWSDNWDPYEFGQDFDPKRSFFEQYNELQKKVPVIALVSDDGVASVNSPYGHDFGFSKNCYMVFIGWKLEDVYYSALLNAGRELGDCLGVQDFSELCYDSVLIDKCNKCRHVQYGSELSECDFCYDCRGCTNCLLSTGLRNKSYYFKNKQYSKEEYKKIVESYKLDTSNGWNKALSEFNEILLTYPRKFSMLRNCVSCTGNDMLHSKNMRDSFYASVSENSRYCMNGVGFKDCYDLSGGGETEYAYEAITPDHSYNNFFSIYSWKNTDIAYCENCHSSNNLFGCASIKHGEYSILNKRYSKEEYIQLKQEIIDHMKKTGEWGQFFPAKLSHFGYNETEAAYVYPLEKQTAAARGFNWQDAIQKTQGKETIKYKDIPTHINDVSQSITQEIMECASCSRNYKIIEQELLLYKKLQVPLPDKCFFCRHEARLKMMNPAQLWTRECMCELVGHTHNGKCRNGFKTSYSPERPEIVYCEQCYQQEIN